MKKARILHYEIVKNEWKYPNGPYRQAPEGAPFAGHWFFVNPFTGMEPWNNMEPPKEEKLPDGFEAIFGERPTSRDRVALVLWEQDIKYFRSAGPPEWASDEQIILARGISENWKMGSPHFYDGRYGFMVRFPKSELPRFEATAWAVINSMQHEVATYQIRLLHQGIVPARIHPFVPPMLVKDVKDVKDQEQSS